MGSVFAPARHLTAISAATVLTLLLGFVVNPVPHEGWFWTGVPECLCLYFTDRPAPELIPPHPPRVHLLRPKMRAVRAPKILCVSADDPDAVLPCDPLFKSASHHARS